MNVLSEERLEKLIFQLLPHYDAFEREDVPASCEGFVYSEMYLDDALIASEEAQGSVYKEVCFSARKARQVRLGMGKKCDIISSWNKSYVFDDKDGNEYTLSFKECVIYEIKKGEINAKSIDQILRYKKAVERLNYYDTIRLVLIGSDVGQVYYILENLNVNINIFTYKCSGVNDICIDWFNRHEHIDESIGFCNKFLVNEFMESSVREGEYEVDKMTVSEFLEQDMFMQDLYNYKKFEQ